MPSMSQTRKKRRDLREGQTRFGITIFRGVSGHRRHLETYGVPVLGCELDSFAAFYRCDSGFRANFRPDDAAAMTCEET